MPKYLFTGSYTLDGIRGVKANAGSARRQAPLSVPQVTTFSAGLA